MTKNKNISIKNWSLEDRPREKLLTNGISSLSNAELIAIIIGSGNKTQTAVDLSKEILFDNKNDLNELGKLDVHDLIKYLGIGEAKAIGIVAAMEIGKRRASGMLQHKSKITSSKDVFDIFYPMLGDIPHEEFWILLLNRSNRVIDKVKISQGGITGTVVDVKLILKKSILKLASGIILCHNHPSGNTDASSEDKRITRKIKDAAKLVDITLLDHIIIADINHISFADKGILN